MNEIITTDNKSTKQIENALVKASDNVRKNGIKLAVYTAEYINRRIDETKWEDLSSEITALTHLGKASISTLRKAGELMIAFPFLQNAEYSKVYELRKIDETDINDFCEKYNISEMTQKQVRKAVDEYYIDTEEVMEEQTEEQDTEEVEEEQDTEEVVEEQDTARNITAELLELVQALDNKVDTAVKKSEVENFHLALTEIYNLIERGC